MALLSLRIQIVSMNKYTPLLARTSLWKWSTLGTYQEAESREQESFNTVWVPGLSHLIN
jgi:hypothetical protein